MTAITPQRARMFVAIKPELAAISGIELALSSLRSAPELAGLRWVDPGKLHFTLRFLGSVALELCPAIAEACASAASNTRAFQLRLAGAGAFPSPRRATVLWLGASGDGAASLIELAQRLDPQLDALGLPREARAFKPHLTIARSPKPSPLTAAVASLASFSVDTTVRALLLVRSHLGQPSARHEVIERCGFGQSR